MDEDDFQDGADHDEAVEPVEQRHEVGGKAEAVQLHQSLAGEQDQEHQIRHVLKERRCLSFYVMLSCYLSCPEGKATLT